VESSEWSEKEEKMMWPRGEGKSYVTPSASRLDLWLAVRDFIPTTASEGEPTSNGTLEIGERERKMSGRAVAKQRVKI